MDVRAYFGFGPWDRYRQGNHIIAFIIPLIVDDHRLRGRLESLEILVLYAGVRSVVSRLNKMTSEDVTDVLRSTCSTELPPGPLPY